MQEAEETYYDAMKREMADRAAKTKAAMDALDPATRVAMEVRLLLPLLCCGRGCLPAGQPAPSRLYCSCTRPVEKWPVASVPSAKEPPHLLHFPSVQGHRPGAYVRLRFTGVPCELVTNFDPRFPILVRAKRGGRVAGGCHALPGCAMDREASG